MRAQDPNAQISTLQSELAAKDQQIQDLQYQLDNAQALIELERQAPAELLLSRNAELPAFEIRSITKLDDKLIELATARKALLEHFQVKTLAAFGIEHEPLAVQAAGAIIAYLRTQSN